jgi:hypothetical protein
MGIYDTYEGCQIKVGHSSMKEFIVGDKVDIPDGIYITFDGIVIIKNSTFIGVNEKIFNKWGAEIDQEKLINLIKPYNPVMAVTDDVTHIKV